MPGSGGRGAWSRGVSAPGGVPGPGEGCVSAPGGCIPACTEGDPPVNRMTNRCKNIILPQTSFGCGNH